MRHGTSTAYQYHRCRCDLCREAANEKMRRWRQGNAAAQGRQRAQREAYRVAEARLREAHRDEFEKLYREEREARGIPSV